VSAQVSNPFERTARALKVNALVFTIDAQMGKRVNPQSRDGAGVIRMMLESWATDVYWLGLCRDAKVGHQKPPSKQTRDAVVAVYRDRETRAVVA
jgi:hypothetical protein